MTHPRFEKRFGDLRKRLSGKKIPARLVFIIMGLLATVWFLVRVIPKPSRATYPCMRAAFPVMATFVMWLSSFTGAFAAFRGTGRLLKRSRYLAALTVFIGALAFSTILINTGSLDLSSKPTATKAAVYHPSNQPFGEALGVVPGRVVWNWDPAATDEDCENTGVDPYVSDDNTDQAVVDAMLNESVMALGDAGDASSAWDAIFRYFNTRKGKGDVGYAPGETIFIKINEGTSSWRSNSDLTRREQAAIAETSPQVTLGILKQLIEEAGVPQASIWVADPKSHIWQESYEKFAAVYPDVNYGDRDGDYDGTRTLLTEASEPSVYFSDKGEVMPDAISDTYYEQMVDADYLINLAALKAHARAGITLTAKNHFGSHNRNSAGHMHPGLVAPDNDVVERPDYGMYRVLVDIMGSSVLGGNTLLFLVDGLWGGTEATQFPVKWTMEPFNDDWPNSIFMSMDQVALESVCFDFLRHEAEVGSDLWYDRPNFAQGVDDYLHQAASSENWPEGISYDPDNSGTPIGSLGVHEHWNNPTLKQYSQNLGEGTGIELYAIPSELVAEAGGFEAKEAATIPTIDGSGSDDCWSTVEWYPIDQLWIPWGENNIPFEDFNGKFKVMWNAETDLLYFLAKTTDDVFVDGYVYPDAGYPSYDILEVFIDEDHSGGRHVFDIEPDVENAENAFSYHIAIDQPDDGSTTSFANVLDIAGTGWGDRTTPDYFDHFPELTVSRDGNTYLWEFSMQIHNDTYDPDNPDASLVQLTEGKVMGLSMAYCDNDDPTEDPLTRDNFFGSVPVEEAAYNDHWQIADDYGVLSLTAAGPSINHAPEVAGSMDDYEFLVKDQEQTIISDLDVYFTDEDGDQLTYSAAASVSGIEVNVEGNVLKATALPGSFGTATITVTANDPEYYNVNTQFGVTVNNHAPTFTGSIDDFTISEPGVTETVIANMDAMFQDPDNDPLTYTATCNDPELTLTILNGRSLKITSTADFVGPEDVNIVASDGELSVQTDFRVYSTVGITEQEMVQSMNLWPNPVDDLLSFSFSSEVSGNVLIRVLGINGQVHEARYMEKAGSGFEATIPVNDLRQGVYILEVHNGGALVTRKFVK